MPGDFDAVALYQALDTERQKRGISWRQVATEFNEASCALNDALTAMGRPSHPFSQSTIASLRSRKNTTCQHALTMLRWLDRAPEEFVTDTTVRPKRLPRAGPDKRLRWDLPALHAALREARRIRRLTWAEVAAEIGCGTNQLTGIHKLRYGIGMVLAMRITRWLDRPAADFVAPAEW